MFINTYVDQREMSDHGMTECKCATGKSAMMPQACKYFKRQPHDKQSKRCMYLKMDVFCDKCIGTDGRELN